MADFEGGWMFPSDGMEVARAAFDAMVQRVQNGGRIIIGTDGAVDIGTRIIDVEQGEAVVWRRATREEFVQAAPIKELAEERVPFYYELRLKLRGTCGTCGQIQWKI